MFSPDLWPHDCPDLNQVDYKIWGYLQYWVYHMCAQDVDELKQESGWGMVRLWADHRW